MEPGTVGAGRKETIRIPGAAFGPPDWRRRARFGPRLVRARWGGSYRARRGRIVRPGGRIVRAGPGRPGLFVRVGALAAGGSCDRGAVTAGDRTPAAARTAGAFTAGLAARGFRVVALAQPSSMWLARSRCCLRLQLKETVTTRKDAPKAHGKGLTQPRRGENVIPGWKGASRAANRGSQGSTSGPRGRRGPLDPRPAAKQQGQGYAIGTGWKNRRIGGVNPGGPSWAATRAFKAVLAPRPRTPGGRARRPAPP